MFLYTNLNNRKKISFTIARKTMRFLRIKLKNPGKNFIKEIFKLLPKS